MSQKSILEQALLQVQTLEEAVKANAKGILASTMKQELNELLKESIEEEDEVNEEPTPEEEETKDVSEEDDKQEETSEQEEDEEDEDEDEDEDSTSDDDSTSDEDSTSLEDYGSEDDDFSSPDDTSFSDDTESPDSVMDMSGASDEEVLAIFKKMKPEDGIIVKKDGDDLEVDFNDDSYIIKLDEEEEPASDIKEEEDFNESKMSDLEEEGSYEEEETVYEIELDETEDGETKEEEMGEAARTKWNPHGNKGGANRSGLPSKKVFKAGSGVTGINEEFEKLKKQNSEYKKALVLFKEKLNEVAVFNANLAYATRLFTEHSTTKQEKLNILKRFDSISTMNESKNLFNIIKSELETTKPVTESVVEKIASTPSSSSSEILSESKAYENPQFKRMKDLMKKIK